jgi:hypothetical protein
MALLLAASSLPQLQEHLPRPALVQEFVNHGGQQFKVYVMGQQVRADVAVGARGAMRFVQAGTVSLLTGRSPPLLCAAGLCDAARVHP